MRRLLVVAGLIVAMASPICAQAPSDDVRYEDYVEARRPVIERRALTADEQAVVKRMAAQIKKAKSWGEVDIASLDELAPMARAGDKAAMRALMDGYGKVHGSTPKHAEKSAEALSGLWAMMLWKEGVQDRDVAKAILYCLQRDQFGAMYGSLKSDGCGFDVYVVGKFERHLGTFAEGKSKAPERIDFRELPLVEPIEKERARFEKILADKKSASTISNDDYTWAGSWVEKQGPEWVERWNKAGVDNYLARQNNEAVAKYNAEAERNRLLAEWIDLEAKWRTAKATGEKLSEVEYNKLVSASFKLQGKYLEPYASENYLRYESLIVALCSEKPGVVCDRQRQIFDKLAADAHQAQLDRELALKNLTLGGNSVSVRSYDQNGNYLGSSNMPAWQADILRGN
jgi:hypothetical protein